MNLTIEDIENVQRQIDELKSKFEEDKFTWKLPEYEDGDKWISVFQSSIYSEADKDYTKVGRRRSTKALAERCAKESKTRDLLSAYRDMLEPEWVDEKGKNVFYIYKDGNSYFLGSNKAYRILGTVYGSKETMQKICAKLNNGDISL